MTIEEFLEKYNQPTYRLEQFNKAVYRQFINSFSELSVWPINLRQKAKNEVKLLTLKSKKTLVSKNKDTIKILFERTSNPGQFIETVLMVHKDSRYTVCVSCMVGCPMNCQFCATGNMGFKANLSAQEIVEQVLYFQRYLKPENKKVTNVVFMGMGEPMINLDNTQAAIEILTNPKKLGMSTGRITISTCGVISPLKKFILDGYKGRLAISLHAPNQVLREKIMPVAKTNLLPELMEIVDLYIKKTNKRVSFEYILIKDLNDQKEHAEELCLLLKHKLAHVNLIPYNKVPHQIFETPNKKTVFAFAQILKDNNISYTIRVTMGADIDAACGQLATQ